MIAGAFVLTSGALEGRYRVHMRTELAAGLNRDTRVLLQGLPIGRVSAVTPLRDPATGRLGFVATLSIRERFADGSRLVLPRSTRALVTQPGVFGTPVVELVTPIGSPDTAALADGDTIPSERVQGMLEALGQIAEELRSEIRVTLEETRALVQHSTGAVDATHLAIRRTSPALLAALDRLGGNLDRADHLLAELSPRATALADSLLVASGTARRALAELSAVATTASELATEHRATIDTIVASLERTAQVLAHFADQVSRRPLRMLTGVTPPEGRPEP